MYIDVAINNIQRYCSDYNRNKRSRDEVWSLIINIVLANINRQMKSDK